MPELPDVVVYVEALERHVVGQTIEGVEVPSVSLVRTWNPPIERIVGLEVLAIRRMGKRIVWQLEGDLHLVFHLMIAGRFKWRKAGAALPRKAGLAAFRFSSGTLLLTEQGSRRRASLHVLGSSAEVAEHDPGGLEPLEVTAEQFRGQLVAENHTLKRALTDPRSLSGIGNAYSDEILHRARLSPLLWTSRLTDQQHERLFQATHEVLSEWTERLRRDVGGRFPEKVTAFRPEMAVHGKYKEPCPVCGAPVQRIVYAKRETNYCAPCQTGGKVMADRGLSRLLKDDWPRSIEEWEARRRPPD